MIRVALLLMAALFAVAPARAEPQDTWVKIATVEIDLKVAGKKKVDLGGAGRYRSLRFDTTPARNLIWLAQAQESQGTLKVTSMPVKLPAAGADISKNLDSLEVVWAAEPAAGGYATLIIWGQLRPVDGAGKGAASDDPAKKADDAERKLAEERRKLEMDRSDMDAKRRAAMDAQREAVIAAEAQRNLGEATRRAAEAKEQQSKADPKPAPPQPAPPPTASGPPPPPQPTPPVVARPTLPAPASRGISDRAPSSPSPGAIGSTSPAPVPPPAVGDAVAAKPNVCTDQAVCTIVDVFFGTDRNATSGSDRLGFGGDRANKLTLGHAFVTVPKSKRAKGSIPLPGLWDKYVRGVPPEGDPAQHFTIPKNGVTVYSTEAEFLLAAKKHIATAGDFKNHAFIFVHGFYVTFDNALYRTAQIAYDLSPDGKPFGTAFLYSWPSAGNATAYIYDQDSAQFSVPHLQAFMRTVIDKTGVENVHIIAHSMGNVALIGALQEMARAETKARVNQIILAAPDLDKQQFERVAVSVERVAKGMTLYASQGDSALALARKVRGGTPRAGESLTPPGPAVVAGIDTIDVSAIPTSVFSWGHDSYADSSELLADIYAVFTKGDHPPTKRSDRFKLLQQGALQYWRYAK